MKLKCFYLLALTGACLLFPSMSYADGFFRFGLSFGSPDFRISFSRTRRSSTPPRRTVVVSPPQRTLCTSHRVQRVHRVAHRHLWAAKPSKVWVPPVYRTVFAGYDHCGRTVYRERLIRPGYYKIVFTDHCSCGASR
jgi:hypothetical protein